MMQKKEQHVTKRIGKELMQKNITEDWIPVNIIKDTTLDYLNAQIHTQTQRYMHTHGELFWVASQSRNIKIAENSYKKNLPALLSSEVNKGLN